MRLYFVVAILSLLCLARPRPADADIAGHAGLNLRADNGAHQIRVMAQYADDAVAGIDQLLAIAPPDDLERLAVAFASFYLHAWQ